MWPVTVLIPLVLKSNVPKQFNTIVADALAPYVTRPSATKVLTMQNKLVVAFHKQGLQLPTECEFCQHNPADTWRNNNVIITSKLRRDVVFT